MKRALLVAFAALQACAPAARPKSQVAMDDDACAVSLELAPIAHHLALVRGHALVHPIGVRVLSDEAFEKLRRSAATEPTEKDRRATEVLALFFSLGIAPQGGDSKDVLGFYDPAHREMVVRENLADTEDVRTVFAHELEHAIQDQTGVLLDLSAVRKEHGADAAHALRCILEGDATVAGSIWDRVGDDFVRAIAADRKLATAGSMSVVSTAAAPYVAGTRLVLDLYTLGGFRLVDAALRAPPRTTEQALHTEKYLRGELPVTVGKAPVPAGWTARARGSMGELVVRAVLSRALPTFVVRDAASGWNGDAYVLAEDAEHRVAGVWTTVWDDEAAARRFERALRVHATFLDGAPGIPPYSIAPTATVERVGTMVTFTRGWNEADAPSAKVLLSTIGPARPPERPIVGTESLPSIVAPVVAADPTASLVGTKLATDAPAMTATVPEGFEASASEPGAAWTIERPGVAPRSRGTMKVVDANAATAPLPSDGEAWTRGDPETRDVTVAGVAAVETRWSVSKDGEAAGTLTLVTFPVCGGKKGVRLVCYARTDDDRAALDGFVRSIVLAPNGACP